MSEIIVDQEVVDVFEKEAEIFFQKIFNCSASNIMLTDLSQLYDFTLFYTEEIEDEVQKELVKNKINGVEDTYQNTMKVYNKHWDKWAKNKIKNVFNVEIETNMLMKDIFLKVHLALQEEKANKVLH